MNPREPDTLIGKHLNGQATREETAALLEDDPAARMLYLKMAHVHASLAEPEQGIDPVETTCPKKHAPEIRRPATVINFSGGIAGARNDDRNRLDLHPFSIPVDGSFRSCDTVNDIATGIRRRSGF